MSQGVKERSEQSEQLKSEDVLELPEVSPEDPQAPEPFEEAFNPFPLEGLLNYLDEAKKYPAPLPRGSMSTPDDWDNEIT